MGLFGKGKGKCSTTGAEKNLAKVIASAGGAASAGGDVNG